MLSWTHMEIYGYWEPRNRNTWLSILNKIKIVNEEFKS